MASSRLLMFHDAPGGDDLHVRRQGFDRQFKAHLIVALAGRAVANGGRAFLFGDFHQLFGDDGPRKARAQQVFLLIHRAHLQRGPDVIGHKLFAHVDDIELFRAGLLGLLMQGFQLFALAHVHRDGNHVVIVIFLQPRDDDGRIQTAAIREHHFFLRHDRLPPEIFRMSVLYNAVYKNTMIFPVKSS